MSKNNNYEQELDKCRKVLETVQSTLSESEVNQLKVYKNIQKHWGSYNQMQNKLEEIFGPSDQHDEFIAKKAMQERFFNDDTQNNKIKKPFYVNNPI